MPLHRTTRRGIRTGRFGLGILVLSLLLVATALPTAAQEAEVGESSEESGSSPNAEAEAQQVVTAPEPPRVAPVAAVGEADRAVPWVQRSLPVIESVAVEVGLGATPAKVGVSDYLIAHPDTEWWFDVIVGFTPIVSDLDDFFGCLGGSGGSCAALAVPIAGGSALKGLGKAAGNATKSLGPVGNPGAFPGLSTTTSKLQHAFKHADDFGVTGNWNKANGHALQDAMEAHIAAPATSRFPGTYRGDSVIHNLDPSTGLNVIQTPSGQLVSGWRLSADQLRHVLENGKLGGG